MGSAMRILLEYLLLASQFEYHSVFSGRTAYCVLPKAAVNDGWRIVRISGGMRKSLSFVSCTLHMYHTCYFSLTMGILFLDYYQQLAKFICAL